MITDARSTFGPLNLLTVWLGLVLLIPSVLVVPGLGAIGTPANLFGLGMFGIWVIGRCTGETNDDLGFQWAYVAFGAYFVGNMMAYLAGHTRGIDPDEALAADRALIAMISYMGVGLVAAESLSDRRDVLEILRRTTYFASFVSVLGAIQFFTDFDPIRFMTLPGLQLNDGAILSIVVEENFDRVSATAGHPIEFGVVMAAMLPLALHFVMHAPNPKILRRSRMVVFLIGLGVPISIGRSSTLALGIAIFMLATIWNRRQLVTAAFFGVLSIFVLRAAVPSLVGTILTLFTGLEDDSSISARTSDYDQAFGFIGQDPWFGRGPNTFDPGEYLLLDNQLLKSTIEIGLFGLLMLFVMIIVGLNLGRSVLSRALDDDARHLGQALVASLWALTITLAFADMLFYAQFTGLLYFLIGVTAALNRTKDQHAPEETALSPKQPVMRKTLSTALRPPDHD
ncbi:MAG: O-antigen ligase [Candidatus Aldehydirespiratoraceae bacterium]|jgi:O-antigen ligase